MIPKFRAWDKESKLMLDVLAIDFKRKYILADFKTRKIYPDLGYWREETDIPFSEIILEQSTGLFDKNGKEIFEGDIIFTEEDMINLSNLESFKMQVPNVVKFDEEKAKYCLYQKGWGNIDFDIKDMKVAGNVHENPELLKGV